MSSFWEFLAIVLAFVAYFEMSAKLDTILKELRKDKNAPDL